MIQTRANPCSKIESMIGGSAAATTTGALDGACDVANAGCAVEAARLQQG